MTTTHNTPTAASLTLAEAMRVAMTPVATHASAVFTGRHRRLEVDHPAVTPDAIAIAHALDTAAGDDLADELVAIVATLDRLAATTARGHVVDTVRPMVLELRNAAAEVVAQAVDCLGALNR